MVSFIVILSASTKWAKEYCISGNWMVVVIRQLWKDIENQQKSILQIKSINECTLWSLIDGGVGIVGGVGKNLKN